MNDVVFVCAHGAGGHMADRSMIRAAQSFEAAGFGVMRFNFPYRERGSGRPDTMPTLKAAVAEAAERARRELAPRKLIIGGRSMGGRAASMLAADGFDCDGLLLLAYPLHPAGQPQKLRDAHLAQIRVPVLCINGTRDPLCDKAVMEPIVARLRGWRMHWLEGADHSFHVRKASGRTDSDVTDEVAAVARDWRMRLDA